MYLCDSSLIPSFLYLPSKVPGYEAFAMSEHSRNAEC